MTAPRSRGKTRIHFHEVAPQKPPLEGEWIVQVTFTSEWSFVITFTITRVLNGKPRADARLPILAASTLRNQLMATQNLMWRAAGLLVNPRWDSDTRVLIGSNTARSRQKYVTHLIENFNQACQALQVPVTMVAGDATEKVKQSDHVKNS